MLTICQAIYHEVGSQTPLEGSLEPQLCTGFYLMLHVNLLVVLAVWSDGSFPFTQLNNNRYFRSTNKKNNFLKIHTKIVYNVPLMIYYIN